MFGHFSLSIASAPLFLFLFGNSDAVLDLLIVDSRSTVFRISIFDSFHIKLELDP